MRRVALAAVAAALSFSIMGCSGSTSDTTTSEASPEPEAATEAETLPESESKAETEATPGPEAEPEAGDASEPEAEPEAETQETPTGQQDSDAKTSETEAETMKMSISGTDVVVEWEDNQAVADLQALVADAPLTVNLSMYGGFEQVGPLGAYLTSNDVKTITSAGDIVLYAGNQIVVFYGSNSWAYTRLGHITSQSAEGMAELLGNGDVSITITSGRE